MNSMKFQYHQTLFVLLTTIIWILLFYYKGIILNKTIDPTLSNNYKHYIKCIRKPIPIFNLICIVFIPLHKIAYHDKNK